MKIFHQLQVQMNLICHTCKSLALIIRKTKTLVDFQVETKTRNQTFMFLKTHPHISTKSKLQLEINNVYTRDQNQNICSVVLCCVVVYGVCSGVDNGMDLQVVEWGRVVGSVYMFNTYSQYWQKGFGFGFGFGLKLIKWTRG